MCLSGWAATQVRKAPSVTCPHHHLGWGTWYLSIQVQGLSPPHGGGGDRDGDIFVLKENLHVYRRVWLPLDLYVELFKKWP